MKKFISSTIILMSIFGKNTMAQWTNSGNTQVTPNDIGIGLTAPAVPDAKLTVISGFIITGGALATIQNPNPTPLPCTLVGKPAISILWEPLGGPQQSSAGLQVCSNTIEKPNALEVYGLDYNNTPYTKTYALQINHKGRMGIGTTVNDDFGLTVGRGSLFKGNFNRVEANLQVQKKFRINTSASLTATDWGPAVFPYTFSVDNGDSRFLGNIELSGDLIIRGLNAQTAGGNEIRLSSNGFIRAREIKVDFDIIPDYVFKPNYFLMPLMELEQYIKKENHLPNIKSEFEYSQNDGLSLGELNLKLLEKIEELTLYTIQLQNQINTFQLQLDSIKKQ